MLEINKDFFRYTMHCVNRNCLNQFPIFGNYPLDKEKNISFA